MLLFIIFSIILIVGIGVLIYYNAHLNTSDIFGYIGAILTGVGFMTVVVSGILIANIRFGEYNEMKRDSVYLQTTYTHFYDDSDDTTRLNLLKEVMNYNTTVVAHRENINNPWVNWYYSKDIAELPLIEIKE